jgi:hypothetical protein
MSVRHSINHDFRPNCKFFLTSYDTSDTCTAMRTERTKIKGCTRAPVGERWTNGILKTPYLSVIYAAYVGGPQPRFSLDKKSII